MSDKTKDSGFVNADTEAAIYQSELANRLSDNAATHSDDCYKDRLDKIADRLKNKPSGDK